MKIGIVTHKVIKGDGQGRVNYEILKQAIDDEHDIIVVSSELDEELKHNKRVKWRRVNVSYIPTALLKLLLFSIISTIYLIQERKNINVLLANGFTTWVKSDINVVHFVHSEWVKSKYHPIKYKININSVYQLFYNYLNSIFEKISFNMANYIVAVSEKVKEELLYSANLSRTKNLTKIINGVDTTEFCPGEFSISGLDIPKDGVKALFVGDIKTNRKNLDTVLLSIKEVPNLYLIIAGESSSSPYPQMAHNLGIEHRVFFLGFRKDISDLMKAVDLFVFPSRYEPYGLVILEAISSGIPVVISEVCGAVEILKNNENCGIIISDYENHFELARLLRELVTDEQKRLEMGRKGRVIALDHDWSNMAKVYLELIMVVHCSKVNKSIG